MSDIVNWSLLGPPVDIGAHFQQGMKMGQAMVAKRRSENALRAYMANPDDPAAINALAVDDPDMAYKLARTRNEALEAQNKAAGIAAQRRIGEQFVGGDQKGAVNAAIGAGQFDLAKQLTDLGPEKGKRAADMLKMAAPIAYKLRQTTDPAARQALWQQARPILEQQGADPAALDGIDVTNDTQLDAYITAGQQVGDLINQGKVTWHQQGEQPSFATDSMGRPVGNANPYRGAGVSPAPVPTPARDPLAPAPAMSGNFFSALTTVPGGEPGAARENGRRHKGRDFAGLTVGTAVPAPMDARLIDQGEDGTSGIWGKWQLADGSYMSVAHLSQPPSAAQVAAGQPLALAGNTGNASTRGSDRAVLHVRTWTPDRQEVDPKTVFGGGQRAAGGPTLTLEQKAQRAIAAGADPAKVRARLAQLQGGR